MIIVVITIIIVICYEQLAIDNFQNIIIRCYNQLKTEAKEIIIKVFEILFLGGIIIFF